MHEQVTPEKILQTGLAFWASKTLLSAIEIGLFTELSRGPEHFDALSGRLGLHPRSARDFLDTLVALGFLRETAITTPIRPRPISSSIGRNPPTSAASSRWRIIACIHSGDTSRRRFAPERRRTSCGPAGLVCSRRSTADPARLKQFLAAMTGISHGANMTIARAFPWTNYHTFVDVGTAQGDLAAQIALANPHLRGVGFDLPEVAPVFEEYVAAVGVADRLTFQPGDFFTQDLPKTDVVLMGHILHDWDLPTKKMLVRKAFDAIPAGGALIVYEAIIDDDRSKNAFGLMMSLNMLIETPGGFDYTGADCAGWMKEAGFSATRVEPLVGPDSMVVGIK